MSTSNPDPAPKPKSKLTSKLVGLLVFAAAVASVFLIDWTTEVEEEPPVVRPIKTMKIEETYAARGRTYPGKVSAGQQVNLSFEVPGTIVQKLVIKGDEVGDGELLMKLDDRDYRNEYDSTVAEQGRAKAQLERLVKAAESGAVSKQEVDNARADLDQAVALLNIKKKALKDTELRARFSGRIGDIFVKQFQTVQAKQAILSLHDLTTIEIDVSIPEGDVAASTPELREKTKLKAIFDFYPDLDPLDVTFKEFSTQADSATQTYTATVEMPRPEGMNLLPGMTATIVVYFPEEALGKDADGFPVPLDAVPVDGVGDYYVWKLKPTGRGTYTVHRTPVTVGEIAGDDIVVQKGLARDDRIALAGVNVLTEGREVRLLEDVAEPGGEADKTTGANVGGDAVVGR